jgi:hypothetical protein
MKSCERADECRSVGGGGANSAPPRAHQSYIIHYALSQLFNYIPSAGWLMQLPLSLFILVNS